MGRVKRIVVLVSNDLTYDQRMQRTCRSLAKAGHEVLLVGRKRPWSIPLKKEPFGQKRLNCFFERGKRFYLLLNLRHFLFLLFSRFDVVLAVDTDTLLAGTLAAVLRGKKLVFDAHEYFTEVPELIGRSGVQAVWKRIERLGIPRAQLCYSVSRGVAEMYESRFHKPFHVIRNLPQKWELKDMREKIPGSIIYQGALNEGRGLEAVIGAMAQLNGRLILAGAGDVEETLKRLVVERGVEKKVEFKGYVTPEDLRQLTPRAMIGLNLLENKGLSYYHSLANKFFAYVQAGIPQVCIDFPEYGRLNAKHEVAVLVENLEEQNLAEQIGRVLTDQQVYDRLHQNCLLAREEWNWEMEEGNLLRLFESLGS